jgi:hypothetical protein
MLRQCARPGCSAPAATTLSYDYAGRTVWLDTLHEDDHPARHDLCGRHAERLSVPNGWRLVVAGADGPLAAVADAPGS